jgi:hypothetical protein
MEGIEHYGESLTSPLLLTKHALPVELKPVKMTTLPFQDRFQSFKENLSVVLNNYRSIMTKINPWSRPLFRPRMQRCFVILNKNQVLSLFYFFY